MQSKDLIRGINLQIYTMLLIYLLSGPVSAQVSANPGYHPFLGDRFNLGIGGFWPDKTFQIRVDGTVPGEQVDIHNDLRHDDSESTLSFNFRWRYGKNWSLWGQYWAIDSQGGSALTEELEWGDSVFQPGSFINAGMNMTVTRVFFGRSFLKNRPGHEFGVGAGFHWMEIDTFIEGQAVTGGNPPAFQRENVEAAFPLPNIGTWYLYSWSPKWVASARLDWLSASIGEYTGGLLNNEIGVNYQVSDTFGVSLAYNNFILDVDVDKPDWRGRVETSQAGIRLSLTASW